MGYGDLHPTSAGTEIFTIFYILTGIGVFVALLASIAQQYIAQKAEAPSARDARRSYEVAARRSGEPRARQSSRVRLLEQDQDRLVARPVARLRPISQVRLLERWASK